MFFEDIIFNKNDFKEEKLFDAEKGFNLGNMFVSEYKGYKNYSESKVVATCEKEELLLKIYIYDFAMNDLSLYLDLHPDDKMMYDKFRDYTIKLDECVKRYERMYGPLNLCESDYSNYKWYEGVWPFIGGNLGV